MEVVKNLSLGLFFLRNFWVCLWPASLRLVAQSSKPLKFCAQTKSPIFTFLDGSSGILNLESWEIRQIKMINAMVANPTNWIYSWISVDVSINLHSVNFPKKHSKMQILLKHKRLLSPFLKFTFSWGTWEKRGFILWIITSYPASLGLTKEHY